MCTPETRQSCQDSAWLWRGTTHPSHAQTDPLLPQIIDLTTELSDERYKGDVTCQALDGERAERLRGTRELQELQVPEPSAPVR